MVFMAKPKICQMFIDKQEQYIYNKNTHFSGINLYILNNFYVRCVLMNTLKGSCT